MNKMKKMCAAMAVVLSVAVAAPAFTGGLDVDAAKKPKLSTKSKNLTVKKSFTLKLKNGSKKAKVSWKTSNKKIAALSKQVKKGDKASVKVTGKKKGSAKITATYKLGKKATKLTCKVKVKAAIVVEAPTPTAAPLPQPTAVPTVTPVPTATPFNYDDYDACRWKTGATFKDTFKDYFISGVSTDKGSLRFKEQAALIRHHFQSVTMGNENKMECMLTNDATDLYPEGISKANVDNYYKTNGEGGVVIDFTNFEELLSYCKANNLKLRYHTFIWHSQSTQYFFLQDMNWSDYTLDEYAEKGWDPENYHKLVDKETAMKRLESYISQIIEYVYSHGYGDVIYAYDVINEATNGGGNVHNYYVDESATSVDALLTKSSIAGAPMFQTNGGVKTSGGKLVTTSSSPEDVEDMFDFEGRVPANDSYWYATYGPDYLYLSFLYAHNAIEKYYNQYQAQFGYTTKPSLIYNDYNTREHHHISLAKYINLACNMVNGTSGVTYCDGIGLQSHSIDQATQERMIKNVVDAGLECQITELDEGSNGDQQASKMKQLYQIYMKYSKNGEYGKTQGDDYIGVTSVTQWGICDGDGSWKANYVFQYFEDENDPNITIEPKPAYYAILQAGGVDCGDKVY